MTTGTIAELWRYPVKSMRGERVERSEVTESGLVGDRAYAVVDAGTGQVASAKHPRLWARLLHCEARWRPAAGGEGQVAIRLPDGSETGSDDPDVDTRLSGLLARPVRLTTVAPEGNSYLAVWPDGVMPDDFLARVAVATEEDEGEGTLTRLTNAAAAPPGTFFDVSALHVVTLATLRRLGELRPGTRFETARFRPNLVLEGDPRPFEENDWTGLSLQLGDQVRAPVLLPAMRCIMTTLPQGGLPRDNEVLRTVSRHNRVDIPGLGRWPCVGAYASVARAGIIATGDSWGAGPAPPTS